MFDVGRRIGPGQHTVEPQIAVQAHLHSDSFYRQRSFVTSLFRTLIIGLDLIFQFFVPTAGFALRERRRQVGNRRGIRTAFGHHAFADVADGIVIEVRHRAHQPVGPVITAQRDLLLRRELQTAVRTEMDHRIGPEGVLRPKIGSDIGMRRRSFGAVDNRKGVVADGGHRLRQQHDVAQVDAGHGQSGFTVPDRAHVAARSFAVDVHDIRIQLLRKRPAHPRLVFRLSDPCGPAVFHKIVEGALGIGAQHRALRHQQLLELPERSGKMLDPVTFGSEPFEQVVERRHGLQPLRRERRLAHALEIIDSHLLLGIGLLLQPDEVGDDLRKVFQPFGNGFEEINTLLIQLLIIQHIRIDRAVQLRNDDTLRHEPAEHAHRILLPLFAGLQNRERREDRDIAFPEPFDGGIGLPHDHTAVREVYDGIGGDLPQKREPLHIRRNRIYVHPRPLQRHDQAVDIRPIAAERVVQPADNGNLRRTFAVITVLPQVFFIFADGAERKLFVQVIQHVRSALDRGIRLNDEEPFAVDMLTDVPGHIAVIALIPVTQVGIDAGLGQAVQIADVVFWIGGGIDIDARPSVGGLLQQAALLLGDLQPHAEA